MGSNPTPSVNSTKKVMANTPWDFPIPSQFPMDNKTIEIKLGELMALLAQTHHWHMVADSLQLEVLRLGKENTKLKESAK